jgi:Microcystin-dependent protein
MEGTIGEIRMFAGNFAPRSWAFCQGQTISIAANNALFAIVGTIYGGDGVTTFKLPDLRGRIPIGNGQGPGLPNYTLGEQVGQENITLTVDQMPSHSHANTVQQASTPGSAKATLNGINNAGGQSAPGGNYLGQDNSAGATPYATAGTPVAMHAGALAATVNVSPPTVTLSLSGGNTPHENIQPVLATNYIICLEGIFPSRN